MTEVGKAYERATENKEEADAMAKKVKQETCEVFFFLLLIVSKRLNDESKEHVNG